MRLSTPIIPVLVLLLCLLQQSTPQQHEDAKSRSNPVVAIQVQPDSPLILTSRTKWFDEKTFEIYIVVINAGNKSITAYTTTRLNLSAPNSNKDCFIQRFPGPGKMLLRDKSDGKSEWYGTDNNGMVPKLEFAVDFVEFSDGSTWGSDYCQTKEYLDGYRSGLKSARALFKEIVAKQGGEKLIAELKQAPMQIDVPPGHSKRWIENFMAGIEGMRSNVLRAYEQLGLPEVDIVLSRPIDASENPAAR
jgi:hypothetical protein